MDQPAHTRLNVWGTNFQPRQWKSRSESLRIRSDPLGRSGHRVIVYNYGRVFVLKVPDGLFLSPLCLVNLDETSRNWSSPCLVKVNER